MALAQRACQHHLGHRKHTSDHTDSARPAHTCSAPPFTGESCASAQCSAHLAYALRFEAGTMAHHCQISAHREPRGRLVKMSGVSAASPSGAKWAPIVWYLPGSSSHSKRVHVPGNFDL